MMGHLSRIRIAIKSLGADQDTITVPVIHGCNVQKYEYSPGSFGIVCGLLDCAGEIRLVSNLPSGVASLPEVAVCIAVSSFFQVNVSPALTLTSVGT